MLKVILSPAKNLVIPQKKTEEVQQPYFLKEAKILNDILRKLSSQELIQLMHISPNLAGLNWKRNQEWCTKGQYPAAFCFNGEAYKGLNIKDFTASELKIAQEKLWILSGLYGLLRPTDAINPYRLEMGCTLNIAHYPNLYHYWSERITKKINQELKSTDMLINVASNEYFKAINVKKLKAQLIQCQFKDYKAGVLKTIMVYAKNARGSMARFIIQHNIQDVEDLKLFNAGGYAFDDNLSTKTNYIFTR